MSQAMINFRNAGSRAFACVSVAVVLGITVGGGLAATGVFPNSASASGLCFDTQHYNTNSHEGTNSSHRGTRTHAPGMWVPDEPPVCDHVSSIWSVVPDGRFAEVGWDSQSSAVPEYQKQDCVWDGNDYPTVFKAWIDDQKMFHCRHYPIAFPLTLHGWYSFSVYNQNGNGYWNSTISGNAIGTAQYLGFVGSSSQTNGERHGTGETSDAAFTGLQYMDVNGNWQTWNAVVCGGNGDGGIDPTWHNSIAQPDATVVLNGPAVGC